MALSERDRRALILGGGALVVLAVYFLGIEPLWGWYDGLASGHAGAANEVARIVGNEREARYYATQIPEWEEQVGKLSVPKPFAEQVTAVSERIVAAAAESGLQLKGASPGAPVAWADDPGLQRASILIDAEADWEKVFKFIAALYRSEGVLSVEQMELSSKKSKKLTVKLTVTFLVQAPAGGRNPWSS